MSTTSTEFYEREYNARAAIPDHPAIFARWAEQARHARRNHAALLDIAYGDSPAERFDFFPTRVRSAPLLTFIHGGYWRSLDKSDFSWIAPPFVERGINVALLNYGLLPSTSLDDIVRQMLRAHAWLYRHADDYAFERSAIYASGHSAGGHLSAMMLAALWNQYASDLPADLVKGGIALSGLFDLEPIVHAPFINADARLDTAGARRLSPASMPGRTGARVLVCAGGLESSEFLRQTGLLAESWPQCPVQRAEAPDRNHLTVCEALAEPGHALHEAALAFVSHG